MRCIVKKSLFLFENNSSDTSETRVFIPEYIQTVDKLIAIPHCPSRGQKSERFDVNRKSFFFDPAQCFMHA